MIALQATVSSSLVLNAVLIISVCLCAISACMPITKLLKFIASPTRFQTICEESNLCTLSWQRPPMYYRRQGTLLNYFINCSTVHKDARRDESATNITLSSTNVTLHVWLQPYRFYNCCVAAVNEAGRGNSACQTIITHEAGKLYSVGFTHTYKSHVYCTAPTVAPTNIEAHQLIDNSTSVFLSWRPPPAQYQNGIIQGYNVEFNSTNARIQYTTQDQYLLIDNLQPYVEYTCRVAAYTTGRGPFSEPLTIVLNSEIGMSKLNTLCIIQCHVHMYGKYYCHVYLKQSA